jgi:hypothetical protein
MSLQQQLIQLHQRFIQLRFLLVHASACVCMHRSASYASLALARALHEAEAEEDRLFFVVGVVFLCVLCIFFSFLCVLPLFWRFMMSTGAGAHDTGA